MNAKEAREIAEKIEKARTDRESAELLKKILSDINYSASCGLFYATAPDMQSSTKKELRKLGFKVKYIVKKYPFTSLYWRISW